jgi:periplasmic protein TonB
MPEIRDEWLHTRVRDLIATGADQLARGNPAAAADTFRTALDLLPANAEPEVRADLFARLAAITGETIESAAPIPTATSVGQPDSSPPLPAEPRRPRTVPPPSFTQLQPEEWEGELDNWRTLPSAIVALAAIPLVLFAVFLVGRAVTPAPPRPVAPEPLRYDIKPDSVYRELAVAEVPARGAEPDNGILYFAPISATLPSLISRVELHSKEPATGPVTVRIKISPAGRVSDPQILASQGKALDDQALRAVMEWRFEPARLDGSPIASAAHVDVHITH